jgi:bacillaene synthase trans-acting acyltransferase/trans-AT polyketide synthase/acyltransferase/oxidoreductase domain-containing protein
MSGEIVFMYSGQGAQYYQMGRELWDRDPAYRAALERYSRLVGPVGGRDLTEILFSRPISDSPGFDRLAETHPLIVAVSLALTDTLAERGIRPDRVLGYSLGETIGAVVSGALSAEEAFWAVRAQAAVFERRADPGRLVAALAPRETVEDLIPAALRGRVHLAAVNAPAHGVYGVAEADCEPFAEALQAGGVAQAVLPIRYAFHTPLIESAQEAFCDIADQLSFRPPCLPVQSCALGGAVRAFEPGHFWRVARGVVRFHETASPLVETPGTRLVDVGPSGTLAGFLKLAGRGDATSGLRGMAEQALIVMNQFGRDVRTLHQVVERLA